MRLIGLFLLAVLFVSCEDIGVDATYDLIGTWHIERINIIVNGEVYKASARKMEETSFDKMRWEVNADLTLDEYIAENKYRQNYEFNEETGFLVVKGFFLYPRQFFLSQIGSQLLASTPEVNPLKQDFDTQSWQKQVEVDAIYLLDGIVAADKIKKSESLQIQYIFRKMIR